MRHTSSEIATSRPRLGVVLALVAVLVTVMAMPAAGAAAVRSTRPVLRIADVLGGTPVPVGSSTLVRTDNGISAQLTSTGLEPGDVVTLWWIVFNDPSECEFGFPGASQCGPADHLAGNGEFSAAYGGGRIAGGDGTVSYGSHLRVGDTSRILEGPGLVDPGNAEVILVLKTHGPAIPDLVSEQISTFGGGCNDQSDAPPGIPGHLLGTPGPNDCAEIQVSPHSPGS